LHKMRLIILSVRKSMAIFLSYKYDC